MTSLFVQAFVYLCAAVIIIPIATRFGLGSVLGYLIAGVIIGPIAGFVGEETNSIQHFAEFGVVMMLFLVGLELEPKMLWTMRHRLLGLGGLQVGGTTAIFTSIGIALGFTWQISLAVGLIFALSSTAIVLQTFSEKGLSGSIGGRNAFSILLFQDLAVIPMLALIPLLASPDIAAQAQAAVSEGHHDDMSWVHGLSGIAYACVVVSSIAAIIVVGHFLSRPLFRYVASSRVPEIATATALMLVIGIAALMNLVGLSPALGTFLAGVVLANSEFRHELESHIAPFKGLLLGLFFITIGAGIDFGVLFGSMGTVLGLTFTVIAFKALVLFILALVFKVRGSDRYLLTLSLAQAGEFGFVLISFSVQNYVFSADMAQTLSLVVALSMMLTPGLFIFFDKVILARFEQEANEGGPDNIDEHASVIIAGVGRFGQIVNRILVANEIKTVVLDRQAEQVENLRSVCIKSYYGDASRSEILYSAGIDNAKLLVVAIDDREQALEIVHFVKRAFPNVIVLARAFDRRHHYALKKAGADNVVSETYHSALAVGKMALRSSGCSEEKATHLVDTFTEVENENHELIYQTWKQQDDPSQYSAEFRELFIQLDQSLRHRVQEVHATHQHEAHSEGGGESKS